MATLLDTNVVSELMRRRRPNSQAIIDYLDGTRKTYGCGSPLIVELKSCELGIQLLPWESAEVAVISNCRGSADSPLGRRLSLGYLPIGQAEKPSGPRYCRARVHRDTVADHWNLGDALIAGTAMSQRHGR